MTIAIVAALHSSGNFEKARQLLAEQGYITNMLGKSRFNRCLHWIAHLFLTLIIFMVAILCVFGLRLYSLVGATWDYFRTDVICSGLHPTPPKELGAAAPFMILDVKPYTVITEVGYMYPGDEYNIGGEGMAGTATLHWTGIDGATFTVIYKSSGYPDYTCRWFIPIENYR